MKRTEVSKQKAAAIISGPQAVKLVSKRVEIGLGFVDVDHLLVVTVQLTSGFEAVRTRLTISKTVFKHEDTCFKKGLCYSRQGSEVGSGISDGEIVSHV